MKIVENIKLSLHLDDKQGEFMSAFGSSEYAGDCSAIQCFDKLANEPGSILVDVRTKAEWIYVGIPVLKSIGKEPVFVEWQSFPENERNEEFVEELCAEFSRRGVDQNTGIYFLCRSGVRSLAAAKAIAQEGFQYCYNISGGFEGPVNESGHRASLEGWKFAGLTWQQF